MPQIEDHLSIRGQVQPVGCDGRTRAAAQPFEPRPIRQRHDDGERPSPLHGRRNAGQYRSLVAPPVGGTPVARGMGTFCFPKVHPEEISKECLETLGFRAAAAHRLYAARARPS